MPRAPCGTALLRVTALLLVGALIAGSCASDEPPIGASPDAAIGTSDNESVGAAEAETARAVADLVDTPSSAAAGHLITAIATECDVRGSCDQRVPWLIDLLRFQVSSNISNEVSGLLEQITGIPATERIPDLIAYGSWASSNRLDGGAGYPDYKRALYERIDPDFGPLLASVEEPTEVAAIQWGGVPVGGIPELNDPERVPAADADWMVPDELVVGVTANGQSAAYPLRILARHELVNDTLGGDRLAIVYCTLCRSALIFDRVVNGQTLDFLTSGLLLNSNKIMLDVQTQTLWHHLRGVGIGGELIGVELDQRTPNLMRWSDWVNEHPDTEVITLPAPIFFDDPERPPIAYDYTPGTAYKSYYDNPNIWFPVLDTPDTFPLKSEVIGITHAGDSLALEVAALGNADPFTVEVGGETFSIEPTGVSARVFNSSGERQLVEQSFWFAWYANHPETRTG